MSAPEADVSIWMGVEAAALPKRQPSAGTQLPHHLCSQRGRTRSRLHRASPPFRRPCTGCLGLPLHPLSRPAKLPRGARLGDYLEWQRSPAIGSVPAPSVGRDGANDQLPAKKKKKKSGPRRRQSSEASRAPQAAEARRHDARGLRSDLGSGRKKGVGLGVSSTKLRSQLANDWSAEESRGLGAPGPRQPGKESPRRASYAARRPRGARALWRPRSLPCSPARRLGSPRRSPRPPPPPPPPPGGSRPR